MPRIPDFLLRSVIYLYPSILDAERGERAGGTGFLVGYPTGLVPDKYYVYVVTNKHVVEKGHSPVVRINTRDGKATGLDLDESDWTMHPNGDDIAVCFPPLDDRVHEFDGAILLERFLTPEIIAENNIGPGDDTYLLGRFVDHEGKQRNLPSVRFGNIAMMPGEPFDVDGHPQEAFLVESRSISGYSGSPVFVHVPMFSYRWAGTEGWAHQAGPWLLGIDCAHLPFKEVVRLDRRTEHPDGWYVTGNSGMMVVIPAWKIVEVLESPEMVKVRDKRLAAS